MTLFYNGFSLNFKYEHCWPSAFFKTGGGQNLSLSTTLTLSPQAVLYVKASAWQPSHDTISANAGAGVRTAQLIWSRGIDWVLAELGGTGAGP